MRRVALALVLMVPMPRAKDMACQSHCYIDGMDHYYIEANDECMCGWKKSFKEIMKKTVVLPDATSKQLYPAHGGLSDD